jgi:hypothetical protein
MVILKGPEASTVAVGVYWTTGDTMNGTKLAGAVFPVVRNRRMRNRTSGGVGGRKGRPFLLPDSIAASVHQARWRPHSSNWRLASGIFS